MLHGAEISFYGDDYAEMEALNYFLCDTFKGFEAFVNNDLMVTEVSECENTGVFSTKILIFKEIENDANLMAFFDTFRKLDL